MKKDNRFLHWLAWCVLAAALFPPAPAQPRDRLGAVIDGRKTVPLRGSRDSRAGEADDAGPVEMTKSINGLGFRFRPSPEQSVALERLLEEQQNPASPAYHSWLTPEDYADRFGLTRNDLATITNWLVAQGFRIDATARSRTWISFSATAEQVRHTFQTELHHYRLDGRLHFANASEARVPAQLEPLLYTIRGLDDFRSEPAARLQPRTNLTNGNHALSPADMAMIYNINPLYAKGIDGTGQKIVVTGQSNFKMSDVQTFRSDFGLPKSDPQLVLVPGSKEPGINDDVVEAILDVEWAGAAAPNATIIFVYSSSVITSVEYAIDQNFAPVISHSFMSCEKRVAAVNGASAAFRALAQQANAQGITWVASSGDTGPAACEYHLTDSVGASGLSVQVPASIPEVTAIGGTRFDEGTTNYWRLASAPDGLSARSYIPEVAWNDTKPGSNLAASGGGASILYPKPLWQTGPGFPDANVRHVPDVSFTASWEHDPYLIRLDGQLRAAGGTSIGTPFFAGVLALLNQHVVKGGFQPKPGLGNVNPQLYQLALTAPAVFHDIVSGDNIIPCKENSADCTTGRYGYRAGPGYDLATGLGSIDVGNLIDNWTTTSSKPTVVATTITVTANPPSLSPTDTTILKAKVKAADGAATPAGSVSFNLGKTSLGTATLSAGEAVVTLKASQLAVGNNSIAVSYAGAGSFGPSEASVNVTVTPAVSKSGILASAVPSPVYAETDVDGEVAWYYHLNLTEVNGVAATLTGFSIDGVDYTADIPQFFGKAAIPANGTLSTSLRATKLAVPLSRVYAFSGVDAAGQRWTQQLTVPFLAAQGSAPMMLTSSPSTIARNPKGDPSCSADFPFYQQLNLQETRGSAIRLTRFIAAGTDYTERILTWFGSLRLGAFGGLRAGICWQMNSLPTTLDYEITGIDQEGNTLTSRLQTTFTAPAPNPGTLTTSKKSIELAGDLSKQATGGIGLDVAPNEQWTVSVFPDNQKTAWLSFYPHSGTGPMQVELSASPSGLRSGVYTATLIFQSLNSLPQFINVPVTYVLGSSQSTVISGAQNAASSQPVFAPGMMMAVNGTHLSIVTAKADSVPLPLKLEGVTATVNGVEAPLYSVSPSQVMLQIPYETPVGAALVVVNNNGLANAYAIQVTATAPGIFPDAGSLASPAEAKLGSTTTIYITGDGESSPMIDTGAAPPASASQLPKPLAPVAVTVGGVKAAITFVGNPGLIGVTQVNFTIPANAPTGAQPVVVTAGAAASAPATLSIQ